MRNRTLVTGFITALTVGALASTPALATRPEWAGNQGGSKPEQRDQRSAERRGDDGRRDVVVESRFGDRHRTASRDYYRRHYSDTRCPPGLAKKHNGCMPPGLARKWSMGRPLPRDVIFHDLPRALLEQFGAPPPRHRYVRVDSDILLIEMGTGIVLDVIENLGW
jgi:Ni/Co efflux regulator RcnB